MMGPGVTTSAETGDDVILKRASTGRVTFSVSILDVHPGLRFNATLLRQQDEWFKLYPKDYMTFNKKFDADRNMRANHFVFSPEFKVKGKMQFFVSKRPFRIAIIFTS